MIGALRTWRGALVQSAALGLIVLCSAAAAAEDWNKIRALLDPNGDGRLSVREAKGPSAAGDTETSCQENPMDLSQGPNGTICVFSDLTAGDPPGDAATNAADNFNFLCNGQITGLKWWGVMAQLGAMAGDCGNGTAFPLGDQWTIRYYLDDGNNLPGMMIAQFVIPQFTPPPVGVDRIDTMRDVGTGIGDLSVLEMHYTLPAPLIVQGGQKYHVEIFNNYTLNPCFFCWQTAPPGDLRSLQRGDDGMGMFAPYTEADANEYDLAVCQEFTADPPSALPPGVTLELAGPVDVPTGCCDFFYTIKNLNCPGAGSINTFYLAIAKGTGAPVCESLSDLGAPVGWNVEFCEPWSGSGRTVYKFTGGVLIEQQSVFGHIRTKVNGMSAVMLDPDDSVPAQGIRAWVSADPAGAPLCGSGTFGPLDTEMGLWSNGVNGLCAIEPIPSLSSPSKAVLAGLVLLGGTLLIFRSRKAVTA